METREDIQKVIERRIKLERASLDFEKEDVEEKYHRSTCELDKKYEYLDFRKILLKRIIENSQLMRGLSDSELRVYQGMYKGYGRELPEPEKVLGATDVIRSLYVHFEGIKQDPAFQILNDLLVRRYNLERKLINTFPNKLTGFYGTIEFANPELQEKYRCLRRLDPRDSLYEHGSDKEIIPLFRMLLLRKMDAPTYWSIMSGEHPVVKYYQGILDSFEKRINDSINYWEQRARMPTPIEKIGYDFQKARQIRRGQGLTQKALAKKLGIKYTKKTPQIFIGIYENGQRRVDKDNLTDNEEKYFMWLKEQGYNPLKL